MYCWCFWDCWYIELKNSSMFDLWTGLYSYKWLRMGKDSSSYQHTHRCPHILNQKHFIMIIYHSKLKNSSGTCWTFLKPGSQLTLYTAPTMMISKIEPNNNGPASFCKRLLWPSWRFLRLTLLRLWLTLLLTFLPLGISLTKLLCWQKKTTFQHR